MTDFWESNLKGGEGVVKESGFIQRLKKIQDEFKKVILKYPQIYLFIKTQPYVLLERELYHA